MTLSDRHRAILKYLAEGCTTKEIGKRIYASEHTVERDIRTLREKLDCRNVVNLVVVAIKRGWIE